MTPASVLYTSYSQDEIQAAEALLCSCTIHERPLASPTQELTVFPWGGMTSNGVLLSNTCPLDNWLMIFQALVKSGMVNLADLHESGQTIATALRLIECGQYADAKLLIIQSLQHPHQGTVPLKGKLTVTRELRKSTRDSILDPRKFRESSLESIFATRELDLSSFESRKIMSLLLD